MAAQFVPDYELWSPGLDNDQLTLGEVRATLPGNPPDDISPIVRLFENPCSPMALRGAVSLERHDCIHILLGRGLVGQDEAFVLGFTMGAVKSITFIELAVFKLLARWFYPTAYRFTPADMKVFDLGVEAGRRARVDKLHKIPLEQKLDQRLGDLRRWLGIDPDQLRAFYAKERALLPTSPASARLPV